MNTATLHPPAAAEGPDADLVAHRAHLRRQLWRTRAMPALGVFVLLFVW